MKMKIGDQEIKGTGSWKLSNGEIPPMEFTGSCTGEKSLIAGIKKGDPIKVRHSDTEIYDAIITNILNNPDGSQTIFFKNKGFTKNTFSTIYVCCFRSNGSFLFK